MAADRHPLPAITGTLSLMKKNYGLWAVLTHLSPRQASHTSEVLFLKYTWLHYSFYLPEMWGVGLSHQAWPISFYMSHRPGTSLPAQRCPVPALSLTAAVGEETSILHYTMGSVCLLPCDGPHSQVVQTTWVRLPHRPTLTTSYG